MSYGRFDCASGCEKLGVLIGEAIHVHKTF